MCRVGLSGVGLLYLNHVQRRSSIAEMLYKCCVLAGMSSSVNKLAHLDDMFVLTGGEPCH